MRKAITLASLIFLQTVAFAQEGSQVFTSPGTFIVPESVTLVTIEVVGAGGNGGGNGGGGGGGGGYAKGDFSVTPGESLEVYIGVAGGGSGTGTSGVISLIKATGGENGTSVSNPNIGGGGAGGEGLGGTIVYTGGNGGGGYYTYFGGGGGGAAGSLGNGSTGGNTIVWDGTNCFTPGGAAGINGGAPGGDGGKGAGFIDNYCIVSDPAGNGASYGGGGGGGNGNGGPPGTGSDGYVEISWGFGTGINAGEESKVLISPTLFSDKISLQNTSGHENYELQSAKGQIMWSGKIIEQRDFSYLPEGIYFLRVQAHWGLQTIKLVKQ